MKRTNTTYRMLLLATLPMLAVWLVMSFGFAQAGPKQATAVIECADASLNSGYKLYLPIINSDPADSVLRVASAVRSPEAASKNIAIGELVDDEISTSGSCNTYQFSVSAGDTIYFGIEQPPSNTDIDWELTDSGGNSLFSSCMACSLNLQTFTAGGSYTLTVGNGVGTYAFQLAEVADPQAFEISVGDIVKPDEPQAGAGTIEGPVATDIYTFEAALGQVLFFDIQAVTRTEAVGWELFDPDGRRLFNDCLSCGDKGPLEISSGGTHTLTVGNAINGAQGTYQFQIIDSSAPSQFEVAIGDTVSPSNPAVGAGNIEYPGAADIYTFEALENQIAFFDLEFYTGTNSLAWELEDPSGGTVFRDCLACGDPGAIEFEMTGTYTLTVGRTNNDSFGTYQFSMLEIPPAQLFKIEIGDTVTENDPAAGAGHIEHTGTFDIYTFEAVSQTVIFVDMLTYESSLAVRWKLVDSAGTQLFRDCVACGDPGTIPLLLGGTYTLTVGTPNSTGTGLYEFKIWDIPAPERFDISLGDVIAPGDPNVGAGTIETPGRFDLYTFFVLAGTPASFNILDVQGTGGIRWQLASPSGATLFRRCLACGDQDLQLLETGEYLLAVGSTRTDQTGTYKFEFVANP